MKHIAVSRREKVIQEKMKKRGVFKMENELFEKTKVSKAYMTLALPVVLGMVVSLIYNMVDTFFIARTGNTALSPAYRSAHRFSR